MQKLDKTLDRSDFSSTSNFPGSKCDNNSHILTAEYMPQSRLPGDCFCTEYERIGNLPFLSRIFFWWEGEGRFVD